MVLRVLDPRLSAEGEALRMAPPLKSLEGAVIGLIDNAKIGTGKLFDQITDILKKDFGAREFLRVRWSRSGGLDLYRTQDSAVLSSTAWADGLVDNPAKGVIRKGELVDFVPYAEMGL